MKPANAISLRHILEVHPMPVAEAVAFVRSHHGTLPKVQAGPWQLAFGAWIHDVPCAAALWHNPSARGLPQTWGELRRMAVAGIAPPNLASAMLARMTKYLRETKRYTRCISYQDVAVHEGTIYRAAGWTPTFVSRPRIRDRSPLRKGTARQYRSDLNGASRAISPKIRWEYSLTGETLCALSPEQFQSALAMVGTEYRK